MLKSWFVLWKQSARQFSCSHLCKFFLQIDLENEDDDDQDKGSQDMYKSSKPAVKRASHSDSDSDLEYKPMVKRSAMVLVVVAKCIQTIMLTPLQYHAKACTILESWQRSPDCHLMHLLS